MFDFQSDKLANETYMVPWHLMKRDVVSSLRLVILQANHPIHITAYRATSFILNKETFLGVSLSMSIYHITDSHCLHTTNDTFHIETYLFVFVNYYLSLRVVPSPWTEEPVPSRVCLRAVSSQVGQYFCMFVFYSIKHCRFLATQSHLDL